MLNLSHDTAALVCADVHVPPTNVYLVPLAVHNLPDGLTSVYTMFIKWQLYLLRDQMPSLTTDLPKFHLVEIWIRKTAFSKCIPFPFFVGSPVKTNDCPNKKKSEVLNQGQFHLWLWSGIQQYLLFTNPNSPINIFEINILSQIEMIIYCLTILLLLILLSPNWQHIEIQEGKEGKVKCYD